MKKIFKVLSLLLALMMVLSLGACGKTKDTDSGQQSSTQSGGDQQSQTSSDSGSDSGSGSSAGEKKIVLKGLDGATVKSQVIVHYKDGSTKIRDMGISKYYPLPQIVETGEGQH